MAELASFVEAIIAEVGQIGYAIVRSDMVPKLAAATRLYEALAFD